jgi:glycosyltransferase involved in cell wall biosynthesis
MTVFLPDHFPQSRNRTQGWPWIVPNQAQNIINSEDDWPKVSIITPSYQQAKFLEETIRSVLLQGYPNLEYIIIDGGSTDGSIEIIKEYAPWLAYWISEKDQGQSQAIRKGLEKSSGKFVAWLNSDDIYGPTSIFEAIRMLKDNEDTGFVYGDCVIIDEQSQRVDFWKTKQSDTRVLLLDGNQIPQQTVFMRKLVLDRIGGINPDLHFIMDYELWIRISCKSNFLYSPNITAFFRLHNSSKTVSQTPQFIDEHLWLINNLPEIDNILNDKERVEARRRVYIRGFIESLFSRDHLSASKYLESALSDQGYPFGSSNLLAQWILDHGSIDTRLVWDHPEVISLCLTVINNINNKEKTKSLLRSCKSYVEMRQVFQGYEAKNYMQVRHHIWKGLQLDPVWLRNKGVWSILAKSYLSWI